MVAAIPLFPLLGFLVNASLGRRLSKGVSGGLGAIGGDEGERRFLLGLRIGRACKDRSRDLYESMCE